MKSTVQNDLTFETPFLAINFDNGEIFLITNKLESRNCGFCVHPGSGSHTYGQYEEYLGSDFEIFTGKIILSN